MPGETVRAVLIIIALAGVVVGGSWIFHASNPVDTTPGALTGSEELSTLVGYTLSTIQYESGERAFTTGGAMALNAISVDVANVTSLVVTLKASITGPTTQDRIDVTIGAPDGESRSGGADVPPNTSGATISVQIIDDWLRAEQPKNTAYATGDPETALIWSRENHTDLSSSGPWSVNVRMSPPPGLARDARATIILTVTYYEAVAITPAPGTAGAATTPASPPGNRA